MIVQTNQGAIEVQPGKIDRAAIIAFSCGQCHALALALHECTGWPIVGAMTWHPVAPIHVAVETPEGFILDIDGVHSKEAWSDEWGDIRNIAPEDARANFDEEYDEPNMKAAYAFVNAVLNFVAAET